METGGTCSCESTTPASIDKVDNKLKLVEICFSHKKNTFYINYFLIKGGLEEMAK